MFTGIVQGTGKVINIKNKKKIFSYIIKFPKKLTTNLKIGDSIANNGCCLSVSDINNCDIKFDLIEETLSKTNFKNIKIGDIINLERSIKYGKEIGGHIISGHIISTAKIIKISKKNKNINLHLYITNSKLMKYIFYKGFISIDGMSLTINQIYNNKISVQIIPLTRSNTNISYKKIGDLVNIEIDIYTQYIVDTTERLYKTIINNQKIK